MPEKNKVAGRYFNRVIRDIEVKFSKFNGKIYITDFILNNELSNIFKITINFVTEQRLKFNDIINSRVTFSFIKSNIKYYSCVMEFEELIDSENLKKISSIYFCNKVILVGEIFLLTKNVRCKIYAPGNPADHIRNIFKSYSIQTEIKVAISDHKYICQYNESDYDFFCRICNHYGIGYYYNAKSNRYVIHDKDTYLDKVKIEGDIPYRVKYFSNRSSLIHKTRTKWSTNTVIGNYDAKDTKNKIFNFLSGYYKDAILKKISENKFNSLNKTLYIFYNVFTPMFAGCKFNEKVVKSILIEDTNFRKIIIECFKSGIEIPEFHNNREVVIANGITQLEVNKVNDNQTIIDNQFDIPVKMFFDDKVIIRARQCSLWLGKFYGCNFPIREQTEVCLIFLDDLMSCAAIIGCYYNNSNSSIMPIDCVGIVTSTIGSSSKEKYMNKIIFKDKKNEEQVILEGKKNMLVQSNEEISFKTNKKIQTESESVLYKIEKDISMESKENISIKSKAVKIDSQEKQEIKSEDSYVVSTKNKIVLTSSKLSIGDKEVEIKCQKLSIQSKIMDVKSDNLQIGAKMIKIESNITSIKLKMLNTEINLLKIQVKMMMIESSLLKIEGKLIMLDGKSIILKSPMVVVL